MAEPEDEVTSKAAGRETTSAPMSDADREPSAETQADEDEPDKP